MELLRNLDFSDGFELHHVEKRVTNRPVAIFNLKNTAKAYPAWQLAQWCCKHNLADATERVTQNGAYVIGDASKCVTVDVEQGTISLELNTSEEYTVSRVEGEGWPHILIEQIFEKKVSVMNAKKIELEIELSIDKVTCRQKEPVEHYHTAQLSWMKPVSAKVVSERAEQATATLSGSVAPCTTSVFRCRASSAQRTAANPKIRANTFISLIRAIT